MLVSKLGGFFALVSFLNFISADDDKQDVYGCGGFIKSDVEMNFSLVKVRVYTKQGALKDTTECSANNGYYMIPVYSKGEFVLKVEGPRGWTFEPSSIDLSIDGVTDRCSLSQNINFQFIGFGVSGKVISKGQDIGPKGVRLVLKSESGKVVSETVSSDGGEYTFKNVLPGSYLVEAFHHKWKFDNKESSVTVQKETGVLTEPIVVAGFDVQGSLISDDEPVSGVNFLLYKTSNDQNRPTDADKMDGCSTGSLPHGVPNLDGYLYLCYVTSDSKGLFEFSSVVSGRYVLVPMYKNDQISYDVSPNRLNIVVKQDSLILKEPFHVAGFEVTGYVRTTAEGSGVSGALVFVNNVQKATTREDGFFHLGSMKTGTYEMKVLKDRLEFDVVKVKVTPSSPFLPDFIVSKFQLCGKILLDETHGSSAVHKKSRLVEYRRMDASIYLTTQSSTNDGVFCGYVQPGSYKISVRINDDERDEGFRLMPLQHVVTVTSEVVDGVTFSQFYAKVSGIVQCLEPCGTLFLTLASAMKSDDHRQIDVTGDDGQREVAFTFEGVMAGTYELTIQNEKWCWLQKALKVNIIDKNVSDLKVVHSGYLVVTSLSHQAKVIFRKSSRSENPLPTSSSHASTPLSFEVSPGLNKFCLKEAGEYEVNVESCHQFEPDVYRFDTSVGGVLLLTATRHPIEISLTTKQKADQIYASIKKMGSNKNDEVIGEVLQVGPLLLSSSDAKLTTFEYQLTYWARSEERLSISLQSDVLLFDPQVVQLNVASDHCPSGRAEFAGRMGAFVEGSVVPPIPAVNVLVKFIQDGRELVAVTDAQGKYRIGPVDADLTYTTTVSKNGYTFSDSSVTPGVFHAYKLAEVVVKVRDVTTGDHLPGVLLSLSGSESFRRNNVTSIGEDELAFSNLGPGDYFLKPMMKEYEFEPSSYSVRVEEGATVNIQVAARRVAYSCFVHVTSLNGEPEVGVFLEAVSEAASKSEDVGSQCQGHQEEGRTGSDGSVRIRGLKPGCTYALRLRSHGMDDVDDPNYIYERTSPRHITLQVDKEDLHNLRFIAFRKVNSMDLSGRIVTNQEYISSIKVHLFEDSNPDNHIHSTSLDVSPFFTFSSIPLDNKDYTIKLSSGLSRSMYTYALPEVHFKTNQSYKHFVIHFQVQSKQTEQELKHSSLLVLPVVLILLYLCFNYKQMFPVFTHFLSGLVDSGKTFVKKSSNKTSPATQQQQQQQQQQLLESLGISETCLFGESALKKRLKAKKI